MNALEELRKKPTDEYTPLEAAVVYLSGKYPEDAAHAADELAHRFVSCTWCGWTLTYGAGEREAAHKKADAHGMTCEKDPRGRAFKALINLFQACSDLPLEEMDRMEKEINEASAAIQAADDGSVAVKWETK